MLRLAIRNVFRHRVRTAIALSTIAFGCASMVVIGGFVHDALSKYRESIIHSRLGHLQIARRGYFRHGGSHPFDYLMERHREVAARLLAMQEVTCVAPRLCFQGLLSTGEASVAFLGEGVEAAAERRIGSSVWIEQGEGLSDGDPWTVILGKGLAERLGAKPGDWLIALSRTAQGSINALDLRVRGTFCTSNRFFDDAAARLYRALELAAQLRLRRRHGIETSRVRPEQVPQGLREEYVRRYGDEGTGPLRVPLEAAYRLLGGLGDELGRRYEERREEMRRHLQLRNRSILAHGDQAISREGFEGFLAFCLEFLDIAPEDLPRFPNLTEESLVPPADG